jgi:diadenosine tetraphosphatase ApaH/serine/threonine PP2A family protein phosphatase
VRCLILSDIHANREALDAVLRHCRGEYDSILCCGDLVGYGADPDYVVEWSRANVTAIVRGNHDKGCAGLEDLDWFNPAARAAAEWTARTMKPANLEYLRELPEGPLAVDTFQIFHGSPLDEDEYLATGPAAAEIRTYLDTQVSMFGHTHLQGGFLCHRNGVKALARPPFDDDREIVQIEHDFWYLINPGSVGQPRDGDPRAAYALYDSGERLVQYRRTPYDVRAAQEKILAAGLPPWLAQRLESGR